MLETEVLSNMKKLEEEARASQKVPSITDTTKTYTGCLHMRDDQKSGQPFWEAKKGFFGPFFHFLQIFHAFGVDQKPRHLLFSLLTIQLSKNRDKHCPESGLGTRTKNRDSPNQIGTNGRSVLT